MAAVTLVDPTRIRVVGLTVEQHTLPPESGVTVEKGSAVAIGPNGGWKLAAAGDKCYGIATGKSNQGMGITAIRTGILDGFDLSNLDYGDNVGVGATDGGLDDAATDADKIGQVIPGTANTLGSPRSKLLHVDCSGR